MLTAERCPGLAVITETLPDPVSSRFSSPLQMKKPRTATKRRAEQAGTKGGLEGLVTRQTQQRDRGRGIKMANRRRWEARGETRAEERSHGGDAAHPSARSVERTNTMHVFEFRSYRKYRCFISVIYAGASHAGSLQLQCFSLTAS